MITVYGIRQCDTCRKALKWMVQQGIEHRFHDLRADGLDRAMLDRWLASPFADQIVNRRSTTWRGLSETGKQASGPALQRLLLDHPTLVKRPVFEAGDTLIAIGFDPSSLRPALHAL